MDNSLVPAFKKQTSFHDAHKTGGSIFISAIDCGRGADNYQKIAEGVESRLGFKFPGAIPVAGPYGSISMQFEGRARIVLPEGWSLKQAVNSYNRDIIDDQGRTRGFLMSSGEQDDENSLLFRPRFTFESHIAASAKAGTGKSGTESYGRYNYFMPSLTSQGEDILPCFMYVHPAFLPRVAYDFTRVMRDMNAIERAESFIAAATRNIFPGAAILTGTETVTIRSGNERALMGKDLPGDMFAHWDDTDIDEKLANLRAGLEAKVPHILGADNCLVLTTFPTQENITAIKQNPPTYEPPIAKSWQKAALWMDSQVRKALGYEP